MIFILRFCFGLTCFVIQFQVGYVGQEPVLFCTTIRENILYGVKNSKYTDKEYTQEDVERVAKMANAHDFILQWEKYVIVNGRNTYSPYYPFCQPV